MRSSILDTIVTVVLFVVTITIAAAATPARAEPGVVVLGAGATEHERAVLTASVEAATRWAAPGERERDAILACVDTPAPWTCLAGGAQVLVITVDHQQDNGVPIAVLHGKLIAPADRGDRGIVVAQRFCEHCADDRLGQQGRELAQELVARLAERQGRTVLDIHTVPPGARISIDGTAVGLSDASFNVAPGSHVVAIRAEHYAYETRAITAAVGTTAEVRIALTPERRSRLVPGAMIAAGLAGLVAGGVMLALDEDPAPGRAQMPTYRQSAGAGIGFGAAGLAALATGIVVAVRF